MARVVEEVAQSTIVGAVTHTLRFDFSIDLHKTCRFDCKRPEDIESGTLLGGKPRQKRSEPDPRLR